MSCLTVPNSCRETSQKRQLSHPASGSLLCRFSCSIWSTSDRDLQLRRDVPLEEQGSWNIFCKSESSWIWPPPLTVSEAFVSVHAPLCQKFSWGLEWNCAGADPYSLWRHCEGSTGAGGGGIELLNWPQTWGKMKKKRTTNCEWKGYCSCKKEKVMQCILFLEVLQSRKRGFWHLSDGSNPPEREQMSICEVYCFDFNPKKEMK